MKLAILKELEAGERRVAATPETVKKLIALGGEVTVETGAGSGAAIPDALFAEAGAVIAGRAAALRGSGIVLVVRASDPASLNGIEPGAWLVGNLDPFGDRTRLEAIAALGVDALAMEFMPRITRAQSMDVLSSQSNLAGYKAVLDTAHEFGRAFPASVVHSCRSIGSP